MKIFKAILVSLILAIVTAETAYAVNVISPDVIDSKTVEHNYIANPSARVGTANTAISAATISRDISSGYKIDGVASFSCDTTSINGYCEWTTKVIKQPDDSGNCMAYAEVKGDASLYRLVAVVGGVEVAQSNVIGNNSGFRSVYVNALCGTTATVRLKQTEAGTSPAVNIGKVTWGRATNILQIPAGGQFVGSISFGTDCNWSRSASSSFGNFADDATCTTTVTQGSGSVAVVGAKRPAIQVNNSLPGNYKVEWTGNLYKNNANAVGCIYRITDGTNTLGQGNVFTGVATVSPFISGQFSYSAPSSSLVFDMQATGDGVSIACDIYGAANNINKAAVYYFPDASQQAIRADQTNYGWTAYTPTFTGFGTVTTSSCWHSRSGPNLLLKCAFTPGTPTTTEARVSLPSGLITASTLPTVSPIADIIHSYTDTFRKYQLLVEPGVGYVTFGTQFAGNAWFNGLSKDLGTRFSVGAQLSWATAIIPIAGWTENQNSPLLTNSMFTRYAGTKPFIDAYVSNSGTPAFSGIFDGFNSSITDNGVGDSTLTFSTAYSAAPRCTCSALEANSSANLTCQLFSVSTTAVRILTKLASAGTALDRDFTIQCVGPQ